MIKIEIYVKKRDIGSNENWRQHRALFNIDSQKEQPCQEKWEKSVKKPS